MNPAFTEKERRLNRIAWIVSGAVFFLVLAMRRFKLDVNADLSMLPAVNSIINTLVFCLLILGFYAIRVKKNKQLHQRIMQLAVLGSALFLVLYVAYHFTSAETTYCGEGNVRYIYFFVLISHVVLAAVILPFILFTYIRAYVQDYERHKRLARWVWPFWVYVSLTGPIVYLMLKPCY